MKSASAPRLAMCLVVHFIPHDRREAVLGDLLERFAEGETAWWLWRQALATIAVALERAIRRHGWSFAAALTVASSVVFLSGAANEILQRGLNRLQERLMWSIWSVYPVSIQNVFWRIASTAVSVSLECVWFAVAGWIAARIYRAYPRVAVCTLAALHLSLSIPWMFRLIENSMTNRRYLDGLISYSMMTCATTLAILVAGFWGARQSRYSGGEQTAN